MIPNGQTRIGKAIRLPLRLIPKSATVRVLSGPNKGCRWIAGSGVHGYWLGTYEKTKATELLSRLRPDAVGYDIGANAGYYTLMLARRCRQVYAFEPLPRNLAYLSKHVELNGLKNVTVMPLAVSDFSGTLHFDNSIDPAMGHLAESGAITVQSVTIDTLDLPAPSLLKIDIEGAGLFAIQGAVNTIVKHRPVIFLALDHQRDYQAIDLLRSLDYSITEFEPREIVATSLSLSD